MLVGSPSELQDFACMDNLCIKIGLDIFEGNHIAAKVVHEMTN